MNEQSYKTVPVNGPRLRATRLRLKLGTRDMARDASTNIMVINLMEKESRMGAQMTLADARRIAETAGLTLTDLFTDAPLASTDTACDQIDADARAVIQLLSLDLRLHERDDLAGALGWDIPRTDAAIASAVPLLAAVGLRITKANTRRGLRPIEESAQTAYERLMTSRAAKSGMNQASARLTLAALEDNGLPGEPRDIDKPSLGYLINVGILRPGRTGEPLHVLTEAAAFGLEVE